MLRGEPLIQSLLSRQSSLVLLPLCEWAPDSIETRLIVQLILGSLTDASTVSKLEPRASAHRRMKAVGTLSKAGAPSKRTARRVRSRLAN